MKWATIIMLQVFFALTSAAKPSQDDLLLQSRIYTKSYYELHNLESAYNYDLYFLQTGTETSQTKLYLFDLKEKKILALYSIQKPVKHQFYDILTMSPTLMYNKAEKLLKVSTLKVDDSTCPNVFKALENVTLPFKAEADPPYELLLGAPNYKVQQRRAKDDVIIETIVTSVSSTEVIKELLAVQEKFEECVKKKINGKIYAKN